MYAEDNKGFHPFAAYANVSANLIQTPDPPFAPVRSVHFYSGLLVGRYLGRNVETILCPARMESLEGYPVAFSSPVPPVVEQLHPPRPEDEPLAEAEPAAAGRDAGLV